MENAPAPAGAPTATLPINWAAGTLSGRVESQSCKRCLPGAADELLYRLAVAVQTRWTELIDTLPTQPFPLHLPPSPSTAAYQAVGAGTADGAMQRGLQRGNSTLMGSTLELLPQGSETNFADLSASA